jgi:hypothetical protein
MTVTPYSAVASMLGYVYQCQYALLATLRRLKNVGTLTVSIETLDDVTFESGGNPVELLQVKHSINGTASLSNASIEIWKTLGIWIDNHSHARIPPDSALFLVTTAIAQPDSAAHALTLRARDVEAAAVSLEKSAMSSTSKENASSYRSYLSLGGADRNELLSRITVIDGQKASDTLQEDLIGEVRLARPSRAPSVAERLEEWWLGRCVRQLSGRQEAILAEEVLSQLEEIADSLRDDSLPIDQIYEDPDPNLYADRTFVRQLCLINMAGEGVLQAVRDYFRAFTLRSRWAREDLISVGELSKYEETLKEEWGIRFRRMREELGEVQAHDAQLSAARELYKWVELEARFALRPRCQEPFLTRGSYQILADTQRVGWHPDFEARLSSLLEPAP